MGWFEFSPKFPLSTRLVCFTIVNICLPSMYAAVVINEKIYTSPKQYSIEQPVHNNPPPRPAEQPTNS